MLRKLAESAPLPNGEGLGVESNRINTRSTLFTH